MVSKIMRRKIALGRPALAEVNEGILLVSSVLAVTSSIPPEPPAIPRRYSRLSLAGVDMAFPFTSLALGQSHFETEAMYSLRHSRPS
jgi:hypothetical protein